MEKATHAGFRYKKGQLVQRVEYTPFGVERYILKPLLNAEPKYTGQVFDIDTDLYYYGARYYDPVVGWFIQPDPLISDIYNPQTLNPYSYVLNNPLKYVDPTGYAAFDLEWEEGLEDKYGLLDDDDEGSAFGMDDGGIAEGTAIGREREVGFDYEREEFRSAGGGFGFDYDNIPQSGTYVPEMWEMTPVRGYMPIPENAPGWYKAIEYGTMGALGGLVLVGVGAIAVDAYGPAVVGEYLRNAPLYNQIAQGAVSGTLAGLTNQRTGLPPQANSLEAWLGWWTMKFAERLSKEMGGSR